MVSLGTGDKHRIFIYTDQQKVRRASYASFRLPLRLALSRWPCHMEALHNCWCPSQEEPIFLSAIPVKGARDPHILMPKESELVCVCVCTCTCTCVRACVRACARIPSLRSHLGSSPMSVFEDYGTLENVGTLCMCTHMHECMPGMYADRNAHVFLRVVIFLSKYTHLTSG